MKQPFFYTSEGICKLRPMLINKDTIIAPIAGSGAINIIRVSGELAFPMLSAIFFTRKLHPVDLSLKKPNTIHLGIIREGPTMIDEVLLSVFKAPHSYTGEDTIEISCHGSTFIKQEILQLLISKGARMANPGEFTFRAFMHGKMDLSQAEAVADLISSHSASSHHIALNQMRGGFSGELKKLREELIHFASLLELELDFSEEDVEFANRADLKALMEKIHITLKTLADSFSRGNVLKSGVPVVIAGRPNAGKSTLLNTLLNEERAIVSDIPGTTRDTIEDEISINGVSFRFIDTAGIRETTDTIEHIGVQRAFEKVQQARIILYLFDVSTLAKEEFEQDIAQIQAKMMSGALLLKTANKADLSPLASELMEVQDLVRISARDKNIDELKARLAAEAEKLKVTEEEVVISNVRHYDSLIKTDEALMQALSGLDNGLSSDLIAMSIRQSLYYLGEITGEISNEDLLGNIFSKFCIGK